MKVIRLTLVFFLFLWAVGISSQDMHFSNYRTASNIFNPANTGDFPGFIKVQGTVRTQYQRVYEHGITGAEMNLHSPLRQKDWISAGINLLYDRTGQLSYTTAGGTMLMAYHFAADKKRNTVISLGGGFEFLKLSVSTLDYRSETTLSGNQDPDLAALSSFNGKLTTFHLGMAVSRRIDKKNFVRTGAAFIRANSPTYSTIGKSSDASLGSRINVSTALSTTLSKQLSLEPAVYFSFSENQTNINLQLISSWKLSSKHKWQGITGLTGRLGESLGIMAGYSAKNTYVTLAFDIVTGQVATVVRNPGAMELGFYHIFHKDHKPTPKPVVFCPRL